MRANFPLIAVSILSLCLTACGDDSGSNESDNRSGTQIGYLIDNAVSGVSYATPSHQGETADDGSFTYESGEVVRFSVGDTLLGEVPGQARVTPFDLAGTTPLTGTARLNDVIHSENDPFHTVINLAVFLQSMDSDGNPENGIEITAEVRALLSGVRLDLHQPWTSFQRDFALRQIMGRANSEAVFASAHGTRHPAVALGHLYRAVEIDPELFGLSRLELRDQATGRLNWVFTYQYDENGFVIERAESVDSENPETLLSSHWRYDANGNMTGLSTGSRWFWWQWRYDERGNLIREEDHYDADAVPELSLSYQYDSNGNVLSSELDSDGDGNVDSYTVSEYSSAGLPLRVYSYNGDESIRFESGYQYDERNNLTQEFLESFPGAVDVPGTVIKSWKYNARDQLARYEYDGEADGVADTTDIWEYDAEGRLIEHQERGQGETITPVAAYAYDAQGRLVKSQYFPIQPFATYLAEWEFHDSYTLYTAVYDANGDTVADTTFIRREHFDVNGNKIQVEQDVEGDGNWDFTEDFAYDANGNLVAPGRQYQPTGWGHLFTSLDPVRPVVTLYPEVQEPIVRASVR
jgi:YD repeat-containing protein